MRRPKSLVALAVRNPVTSTTDAPSPLAKRGVSPELLEIDTYGVAAIARDALEYSFLRGVGRFKGPPGIAPEPATP